MMGLVAPYATGHREHLSPCKPTPPEVGTPAKLKIGSSEFLSASCQLLVPSSWSGVVFVLLEFEACRKTKLERESGSYERFYIDKLKTYAGQEFGNTCVNEQKHQHYIVCACPGRAKRALYAGKPKTVFEDMLA